MVTRNRLIAFIQNAELAWERVVFSFNIRTTPITFNEIDHYRLPFRFSTRTKVFQYYRRFWSTVYANRMICSAGFRNVRGRLYSPDADTGGLPSKVLGLRIIRQTNTRIIADAVLDDPSLGRITIRYVISRNPNTGALTIILRRDRTPDYRYEPCMRRSTRSSR